ncbi:hypothetical protein BU24DRAFT_482612 [Aaosphaeria arxii CBS 175.79]|uniref:C2H2-type domain-containing protein n=1 Tax=Aaosphaeria arxii CBS 175.79 TaxID=1450172 RepID=A0A6A5XQR2_9PLEO|nr:uncharacterized protein BU24DRAFT_482612 [Aaosphaeria arxii CBS 175.79]KAF2015101.1 hypothetical protein BU24DRAFT_482612 [Aaosphaeria arxii CBS 175.79]
MKSQEQTFVNQLSWKLSIWSKYLGVQGRDGLALDDRLQDYGDVKDAIIGLLQLISARLRNAVQSTEEANVTASDGIKNDISEEVAIQQRWRVYGGRPWEAVEMALDTLLELAATIKKSTIPMTAAHLDVHYPRPDDSYFPQLASTLARSRFPAAPKSLTDQLGYSIYLRRKRLLYQQRHDRKVSFPSSEKLPNVGFLEENSSPPGAPETTPYLVPREVRARVSFSNVAPSMTQASRIDGSLLRRRMKSRTVISSRVSGKISREETHIDYPPLPEPDKTAPGWCVCPFCSRPLECAGLSPTRWIKHVEGDLKPYVCISEKCRTSHHYFSSQREWADHMESFHGGSWYQRIHMTTWACNLDHEEQQEFNDEAQFREHITALHPDISELRVNSLARHSRGTGLRDRNACPLCERVPHGLSQGKDADIQQQLLSHIADHLKSLAFFSLPSTDRQVINDTNNSSNNSNLNRSSSNDGFPESLVEQSSMSIADGEAPHFDRLSLVPEIPLDAASCNVEEDWSNLNLPEKDTGDNVVVEHFKSLQEAQATDAERSTRQQRSKKDMEERLTLETKIAQNPIVQHTIAIINLFRSLRKIVGSKCPLKTEGCRTGMGVHFGKICAQESIFMFTSSAILSINIPLDTSDPLAFMKNTVDLVTVDRLNAYIRDCSPQHKDYLHTTENLQHRLEVIIDCLSSDKSNPRSTSPDPVNWNHDKSVLSEVQYHWDMTELQLRSIDFYNEMLRAITQQILNSGTSSRDPSEICQRYLCPKCTGTLANFPNTTTYTRKYLGSMIEFAAPNDCWICMQICEASSRIVHLDDSYLVYANVKPMRTVPNAMVLLSGDGMDDSCVETCHIYQLERPKLASADGTLGHLYLFEGGKHLGGEMNKFTRIERLRLAHDLVDSILHIYDVGLSDQCLDLFSVHETVRRPYFTFYGRVLEDCEVPISKEPSLNWTLYVVAIQLIELWTNKKIEDLEDDEEMVLSEEFPFGPMWGHAVQIVERGLLQDAGRKYEEAVKSCLFCDMACDVAEDFRLPEFRNAVRREVLSKLAEALEMHIFNAQ